jgi:hypothetical protein
MVSSCQEEPCENVDCQNGGTCIDGICECPAGFLGDDCSLVDVSSLVGNYSTRYVGCFQVSPDHVVQIDQSMTPGFALSFINLGDYACPSSSDGRLRLDARLHGSTIALSEQRVCEEGSFGGYLFSGTGTVFGDSISLDFQVQYEVDGNLQNDNCTAILIKP